MSTIENLIGVLGILLVCLLPTLALYSFSDKWAQTDASLRFGLSGLISLGALGTIILFVGLFSTAAIPFVVLLLAGAAGIASPKRLSGHVKDVVRSYRQNGPRGIEWIFLIAEKICEVIVLIGVFAPPDTQEWDSLAYHLAVPKLWLSQGHISYIPYIHQSNFPGAFDYLYLFGLRIGSAGAKAFVYAAAKFGGMAIFGFARQIYGRRAAWWAVIAYATAPVVLWLSGTAYIDVPNGLCAGLGIALAALYCQSLDKRHLWLCAIMLGLAAGSKYTGLQTIFAVAFILLLVGLKRKQGGQFFKSAVIVGLVAVAIASPWYIKNLVNTNNPVYPFFYSKLGGTNWSAPQAEEYTREQNSFGVGRDPTTGHLDSSEIGHAILGLAYQPGRYINPAQTVGGGTPLGAIGVVVLCALLAWAFSGRSSAFELFNLAAVGVSLLLWFFLSQQSRYIVTLAIPLSILLGGGIARLRAGPWLKGIAVAQAIYSIGLVGFSLTKDQLPVVLGIQTESDYLSHRVPFYTAAQFINQTVPKTGRVALYDEVFGYELNVPYYWANPGHSNEVPYDSMRNGHDYVVAMKKMGFTHVYLNLAPSVHDPALVQAWIGAMGLNGMPESWPPDIAQKYSINGWEQHFVPLIADAAAHQELTLVKAFNSGILFQITPK